MLSSRLEEPSDILDCDIEFDAAAHDSSGAGGQVDQLLYGIGCVASGPSFEEPTEQDEGDDGRRGVKVERQLAVARDARGLEEGGEEDRRDAVQVGGRCSDRDERVHVRRAMARDLEGAGVEAAARVELHRCREREFQPRVG